ncbi:DUF4214 domain-containing protein [Undibacterium fentianense]|uniref:DUF4214 domain-containing protein n=1 Tax=Undibacterium fentianense TaxID=2828728 RepID=A0A941E6J0_9BURK|nr:DUF4214 domain-containing protein [Undibacterium fentianense]MBR7800683.1 DUF4214 domain-containing protein [Undibacterium fentianense]
MSHVVKLRQSALLCSIIAASLVACGGEAVKQTPPPKAIGLGIFSGPPAAPVDTVSFAGIRNNFSITRTATGFAVQDKIGSGGTVNVSNTSILKFNDVSINLAVGDKSKTIPEASLKTLVELYIAFFNRVPDADGLSYWIDKIKDGMTVDALSNSFYGAAVEYSSLTGYSASMSNADFVKIIYKNVLGRTGTTAPPDADINYWAGQLASGNSSKGNLVATMLNSAHTFAGDPTWGWVTQLLDNKVNVGLFFAVEQGLNYNSPQESIEKTMAIVAKITAASTTEAKNTINMLDTSFNASAAFNPNGNTGNNNGNNNGNNGGNNSGSGTGASKDCYNMNLIKQGVTYSTEMSSTVASLGTTTVYVVNYKPNGTVNFKGTNAQELLTDTTILSGVGTGTVSKIKSYINVYDNESLAYGNIVTLTLPGFGDYNVVATMTPPKRTPFSMAVNETYEQTYKVKQEAVGSAFPITYPEVTQTDKLSFLGIESVTVPAGTFSACKFKNETTSDGATGIAYTWQIADAKYRGLTAKIEAKDVLTVATKLSIQGQ